MGLRSIINSLFKRGNPNVRGIMDRVFISLYAYRVLYYCFTYVSPIRTIIALFLSVLSICGDINKGCTAISLVVKRVRFKARCDIKCNLPKLSKMYFYTRDISYLHSRDVYKTFNTEIFDMESRQYFLVFQRTSLNCEKFIRITKLYSKRR